MKRRRFMPVFFSCLILVFCLSGCAAKSGSGVVPGDTIVMDFTCRLNDGTLAATTISQVAQSPLEEKSALFPENKQTYEPFSMRVEGPESGNKRPVFTGYERILAFVLAKKMAGARQGEQKSVVVEAKDVAPAERSIMDMARVRKRPKRVTKPLDQWAARLGRNPEIGDTITIDPALPGTVVSVDDRVATVLFSAKDGEIVQTPIGPAVVKEKEDSFELHIKAAPGDLVVSSQMVGRVMKVDERMITIDYGHPFGYTPMVCDVVVRSVEKAQKGDLK